ncbi:uncharacterized protein A4U43_C08F23510 [Asparagus officinalis]|uniref:calmodulin-like protein 1 n=1 Tax=Asparagus officinalis TaxID=4686 RepID=UPI00098E2312|nr:calmodulin-like protein 1 [Asparagus officinalis]ONK60864.1 uncharacterized protein A4U43_C08F23510 [Asparagus officinalis]
MSKLKILNFQYNLMKKLPLKPVKWLSIKDRQVSDSQLNFLPDVDEMRRVFQKIDTNGDNKISSEELINHLEVFGKEDASTEANLIFSVADKDNDGYISFREFMDMHKRGVSASDIRSAFWVFDQNQDGRIDAEEVMEVLSKIGERCTIEECRKMVRQVDKNGDGLVDMDEFMAMMTCNMKLI